MTTWLFNLLVAILLIGTSVGGGAMDLVERDEGAQHESGAEKRDAKLEQALPELPAPRSLPSFEAVVTVDHGVPAFRDTASKKVLPPRQFTERRLI